MSLVSVDLFGVKQDKVARAIDVLRAFEPEEGYIDAYSGGKDSTVIHDLCKRAGVRHETHYSVTTVDPPELVRHIISQFDTVVYDMPDGTNKYYSVSQHYPPLQRTDSPHGSTVHFDIPETPMRKLIPQKKMPPTRLARYCCEALKETHGEGRIVVTGVRWAESQNRKDNQGLVTIFFDRDVMLTAEELGANFTSTVRGGLFLTWITMRSAGRLNNATAQTRRLSTQS